MCGKCAVGAESVGVKYNTTKYKCFTIIIAIIKCNLDHDST